MPGARPPRGPSRQALLAEVQALRQRVAALEQAKHDLEVMLEMATDHADDLSEALQQERDDLETMRLFAKIEAKPKSCHSKLICAFAGCVHFATHTPSVGSA